MKARVLIRKPKSELGELSALFNAMLERIETLIKGMRQTLDNVSHDLRTPLSRMKANLEMALQSGKASTREETLINCVENVEQINSIIDAYMDVTKAESGILNISFEETSLETVVNEVTAVYDLVAEEQSIEIKKQTQGDVTVQADRSRLRQLIANLLDNAIKYSPQGGKILIKSYRDDQKIILEIHDQGIGIEEKDLDLIFDRLYRADKSRSQKGLGLGLSIVKAIAKAHGAEVEVESVVGAGSTFRVIFNSDIAP